MFFKELIDENPTQTEGKELHTSQNTRALKDFRLSDRACRGANFTRRAEVQRFWAQFLQKTAEATSLQRRGSGPVTEDDSGVDV